MAVDERARHALYERLEVEIGMDAANTLMEYLPPVGWADVATKRDLDALEGRVNSRFDVVDSRFDVVDSRFDALDSRFDAINSKIGEETAKVNSALQRDINTAINAQTRLIIFAVLGQTLAFTGGIVAVAHFL